jgi:ferredoxin--NADP+ reductase
MDILAPDIAKKILPGQFVMIRIDELGERIPLTCSSANPTEGTITLIFQAVGTTTCRLSLLKTGDYLQDVCGPLGNPTELDGVERACVVGGGLGSAISYPQAKYLHEHGCDVDVIMGFRTKELIILEREMKQCANRIEIVTDDGSNGNKNLVTAPLRQWLENGAKYELIVAVGPIIMMKFVAQIATEFGVKSLVSLNPLMVDGTGMCGACKVKVGDNYYHACVDGPDFDGALVDFDYAMRRGVMYAPYEKLSRDTFRKKLIAEGRSCKIRKQPKSKA